ncbi:MAG: choice-of-anchor U domain-containing protein, partial [Aquificaceae bacterium]|nr:choice-of-anchor U domain-containing protein [Aquificaceae bacterium]
KTELGEIVFTKPVAYQEIGGKRVEVPVSYKVAKVDNKVVYGFEVGNYDKSKELVIDPLVQSTYLGGSGYDRAFDMDLDSSGNVYVAGYTISNDFPTTTGAYDTTYNGGSYDAFIAKFDSLSATSGNTGSVNTPNGQVNISIQNGTFTQPPQSQTNIPPLPSGFSAPYGAISFKAQVPQGATITITINFPQAIPQGAKLYKLINNQYIEVTNVQFAGNTATFQVQDGSSLDADG